MATKRARRQPPPDPRKYAKYVVPGLGQSLLTQDWGKRERDNASRGIWTPRPKRRWT